MKNDNSIIIITMLDNWWWRD